VDIGTKISGSAHLLFLAAIVFGGPLFNSERTETFRISDVSIISEAEFSALYSSTPQASTEFSDPVIPSLTQADQPLTPAVETPPETNDVPEPQTPQAQGERPDVASQETAEKPLLNVDSPELADQAADTLGTALIVPDAPLSVQDSGGQKQPDQLSLLQPAPRPAPRIDTTAAPKPPTDADTAPETQTSTTPDPAATQQQDSQQEQAPKEASTEIVTEADVIENSAAPVKSSRPKGRPQGLAANAKAARVKAEQAKAARLQAERDRQAREIEEALRAAQSGAAPAAAPTGPPLTGGERDGLILAIKQCWNVPIGLEGAAELVVVLRVDLNRDGSLAASPKMIEPTGPAQGTIKQAFEAGRRALIRCAPYNNLPPEKYERWRRVEVVFNPRNMVVK
jgi:hypothetical protein